MKYEIFDNLLPPSLVKDLEETFSNREFPWYYTESSSGVEGQKDFNNKCVKDCPQFVHSIIEGDEDTSYVANIIKPILYFLEEKTETEILDVWRIKANCLLPDNKDNTQFFNTPHIDHDITNYVSMVYYINDSDGPTRLYNKRAGEDFTNLELVGEVLPKKGRCVIFPSCYYHASSNPTLGRRMVLNFILGI